jgi:galactose mutarotase-like enzyme
MTGKEKSKTGEEIKLFSNGIQAILSTDGGCLQRFIINAQDILYPETLFQINGQLKKRGGLPILFPWAGALKNLPQHGFGRNLKWKKLPVSHDLIRKKAVLELTSNKETWQIFSYHFRCQLKVEIKDRDRDGGGDGDKAKRELFYLLTVFNEDHQVMPISPGLHPYFNIPHSDFALLETNIDGFEPKNYELEKTLFFPLQSVRLQIARLGEIKIDYGHDFRRKQSKLAVWTDNKNYLCVEPWVSSLGGFLREEERINLSPGQKAEFSFSLKFFPR